MVVHNARIRVYLERFAVYSDIFLSFAFYLNNMQTPGGEEAQTGKSSLSFTTCLGIVSPDIPGKLRHEKTWEIKLYQLFKALCVQHDPLASALFPFRPLSFIFSFIVLSFVLRFQAEHHIL